MNRFSRRSYCREEWQWLNQEMDPWSTDSDDKTLELFRHQVCDAAKALFATLSKILAVDEMLDGLFRSFGKGFVPQSHLQFSSVGDTR